MTNYLSCAETAKLVRAALAHHFPRVKFRVRSHTYSGGASIDVSWTDGPAWKRVQRVCDQFAGSGFDTTIDFRYGVTHWLLPDGSTCVAYSDGTEGSMGVIPATENPKPHPEAVRVRFGAGKVYCAREISNCQAKLELAIELLRVQCKVDIGTDGWEYFGNRTLHRIAIQMLYDQDLLLGDTLQDAFRLVVMREERKENQS